MSEDFMEMADKAVTKLNKNKPKNKTKGNLEKGKPVEMPSAMEMAMAGADMLPTKIKVLAAVGVSAAIYGLVNFGIDIYHFIIWII